MPPRQVERDAGLVRTSRRAGDWVEAYTSRHATPFGDAIALEGLRLLTEALPRIRREPGDLDARQDAFSGAWLAISAPASGVPLGARHAIGRVLGGLFGVPHGYTSCVMLPAALRWSEPASRDRQARITGLFSADSASAGVARLVSDLGLPGSLRDLKIGLDRYGAILERSLVMLKHHSVAGNPRLVDTEADVLEILALAE